jgi:hypothetical protein
MPTEEIIALLASYSFAGPTFQTISHPALREQRKADIF